MQTETMMSGPQTIESMREWLTQKLGRELTLSKVKYAGAEMFMVDYVNHAAPATKLVSPTEDGAVEALYTYLQSHKQPSELESEG